MADSEGQRDLIQQFCGITGVSEDRARFYLDAAAWSLDAALAGFFDHADGGEQTSHDDVHHHPAPAPASRPTIGVPDKQAGKHAAAEKSSSQSSRFATFGSLRTEESDSSGEEGQAYYAGGSERGAGQQIIGPSKKKKGDDSFISDMFRAAREHGAEVMEPQSGASSGRRQPTFGGRAYRLGDNEMQSQVIEGDHSEPDRPQIDMALKFWKNGFSIDNGPLRDFHDPANQKFLQEIRRGEVPQELIHQARGSEVHVNMEDHSHEDYVKPPTVVKPFTGEGHRLGCPSDPVSFANDAARSMAGTTTASSSAAGSSREAEAVAAVQLNSSEPITTLQIRLADGSKLIAKFNHAHRISDVRRYIITIRPEYSVANFILMTTFPNAELSDETLTLGAAKLLNAVIVQRMK